MYCQAARDKAKGNLSGSDHERANQLADPVGHQLMASCQGLNQIVKLAVLYTGKFKYAFWELWMHLY